MASGAGNIVNQRAEVPAKKRRTQEERRDAAHRRMIRAAIRLIARQGYSQTTLAQVGVEAGYSSGLVSHHFGSKKGLLEELVHRIAVRFFQDQLQPATNLPSGLAALDAMIDTYISELQLRPERMRALYVLMGEALGPLRELGEVFAELNRELRGVVAELIRRGQAAGEIRADIDPDTEAATYVGMLRGISNQWMAEPTCLDLDAARRSLKHAARHHLAA